MNIDLAANTRFNDAEGLRDFFLVHHFVHLQTANALSAKYKVPVSTFAVESPAAQEEWIAMMREGQEGNPRQTPPALRDWLNIHADMHNQSYALLGNTPTVAPDLSIADFTKEVSFADWMSVHQSMHDFEYSSLGLT